MPEPVTASVLVAIIAEQAAQELGKRIGGAIADRIFGSELSENQALLKSIARDVKQILVEVRQIYSIVVQIPNIVHGEILRNELYKAHVNLESNIETFLILKSWNVTLGYDALVNILNSWKLITEKEDMVDMIWEIPKYADFLMMITRNEAKPIVLSGLDYKIDILESRKNILYNDHLLPAIKRIEALFASGYVASGKFLSDKPWIEYTMMPDKYNRVRVCEPRGPKFLNSSLGLEILSNKNDDVDSFLLAICDINIVPDIVWNGQRNSVNSELISLGNRLNEVTQELRTVIATLNLLIIYKEKLNTGIKPLAESRAKYIQSESLFNLA